MLITVTLFTLLFDYVIWREEIKSVILMANACLQNSKSPYITVRHKFILHMKWLYKKLLLLRLDLNVQNEVWRSMENIIKPFFNRKSSLSITWKQFES